MVPVAWIEWQIRIAQGEPLPLEQSAIRVDGWAIEARINCEDPARNYRPELGTVGRYVEPEGAGVRVDSGIAEGSEIPSQYDSMVAKLIGHGGTRAQAMERLHAALVGFEAAGIGTNQALLTDIVEHSLFRSGRLTTGFLGEAFAGGWRGDATALRDARIAAALSAVRAGSGRSGADPTDYWLQQSGYRFMSAGGRAALARWRVDFEGDEVAVTVARGRDPDGWRVGLQGEAPIDVRAQWLADDRLQLTTQHGVARRFTLVRDGDATVVNHLGSRWRLSVASEVEALARVAAQAGTQGSVVVSEMPGAVTTIHVAAGDTVEAGDVLVVMEAMKLIFPLAAPRAGTIAAVRCEVGEIVPRGRTLVELAPLDTTAAAASEAS